MGCEHRPTISETIGQSTGQSNEGNDEVYYYSDYQPDDGGYDQHDGEGDVGTVGGRHGEDWDEEFVAHMRSIFPDAGKGSPGLDVRALDALDRLDERVLSAAICSGLQIAWDERHGRWLFWQD